MLLKSLVIVLMIGTVLTINLKHNKREVTAYVARITTLRALALTIR
jgi:hypothetical protein